MKYKLGKRSRSNLLHVHPDLVLVVGRAIQITDVDFSVIEGARTVERQKELIASGASSLKDPTKSRHVMNEKGICFAVDVAPYVAGRIRWDWPLFHKLDKAFKQAAKELGIPIEWGGDWTSFKDGPHFQLPKRTYK